MRSASSNPALPLAGKSSADRAAHPVSGPRGEYQLALGYLRAFVVILVIGHHAYLAYCTFVVASPFGAFPPLWKAYPVVDTQRWIGFDLVVAINDVFFMSLMFFLSGLFVWPSLERKGRETYLHDRAVRLGIPFVVSAAILAPLAYYPSYLTTAAAPHPLDFLRHWFSLGAGPAWFLWVLLLFDRVAADLFSRRPHWDDQVRRSLATSLRRPVAFFVTIVAVSAAAYVPLLLLFGPFAWPSVGPFTFQACRLLHYAVWFFAGVATGAYGIDRSLFAPDGPLGRQWPSWVGGAALLFGIHLYVALATFTPAGAPSPVWVIGAGLAFVLACAALSLSLIAVFLRFVRRPTPVLESLRANAYGMYVVHFAFVTWLQYALLSLTLPAAAKGVLVLFGAALLSWLATAVIRRNSVVARIL